MTESGVSQADERRAKLCFRVLVVLVLAGAVLLRAGIIIELPTISRDGVAYCWQARDLGQRGIASLRSDEYGQHPLFAAAILAVERALVAAGFDESPLLWQACGQAVSVSFGMLLVVMCGLLARELAQRLFPQLDPRNAALWALALAAVLPWYAHLSADVMSETMHLSFYLAGAILLMRLERRGVAFGCGVLSGLAFLTRPEGAVVALAALAVLATQFHARRGASLVGRGLLVLAGFLIAAAPYWVASGRLSTKLHKAPIQQFEAGADAPTAAIAPAANRDSFVVYGDCAGGGLVRSTSATGDGRYEARWGPRSEPEQARLQLRDVAWFEAAPLALLETFRAGRVVVPLLAIPVLILLRKRLFGPVLFGLVSCAALHFALTCVLLARNGYLNPRHTLVVISLLLPASAIFLEQVRVFSMRTGRWWLAAAVTLAALTPLVKYALRVPHLADMHLRRAAEWLVAHDKQAREHLLLSGDSETRVAFYAGMRFQPWPEEAADAEQRYAGLRSHALDRAPGYQADYFAIETGPGDELAGNDELLARLLAEPALRGVAREVHRETGPTQATLHLLRLEWPAADTP